MLSGFKILRNLRCNQEGNVFILVAAFILVSFAIGGAAIDFGKAQLVKMKQQRAVDAAALAAAGIYTANFPKEQQLQIRAAAATRYYNLNYPASYLGEQRNPVQFNATTLPDDSIRISVGASSSMNNDFLDVVGLDSVALNSSVTVMHPSKTLPDFDVVMVVDESGSTGANMPNSTKTRMEAEVEAIKIMLGSLFPLDDRDNKNLRFGLVGYTGAIVHAFGLTSDETQAISYIEQLKPYWQNYDHWGLEAGFKMISGDWKGFIPPKDCRPYDDDSGFVICKVEQNTDVPPPATNRDDGKLLSDSKYVVFITDGQIMREPPPCTGMGAPPGCPNYNAFLAECDKIKAAGVTLYTINFVSQDSGDVAPLTACASDPKKYFYAPDQDSLKSILTGIAKQIYSIRIND